MGLGKLARGMGKAGAALEGVRLLWIAGSALVAAIRGSRSEKDAGDSGDAADTDQHAKQPVDQP
jgi:hypothetical protein